MNILFYNCYDVSPQKGGTERITDTIAVELRKRGHTVFLAYECNIDSKLKRTKFDGRIKIDRLSNHENLLKLYDFIKLNKIEIVVIQGLLDKAFPIKNISTKLNVRIVFVHHFNPGAEETFMSYHYIINNIRNGGESKFRGVLKLLLFPALKLRYIKKLHDNYKRTYEAADKTVLLSKGFVSDFAQYARINETSKFYVIHNALSFSNYFDILDYCEKQKEIIIVSRLEERQKRISLALLIWSQIENRPEFNDWTLRIIGSGSDGHKYINFVNRNHLERVVFEGRQDPEPYYKRASIFMMTSSFEGWGLTITEAQQNGVVPIVFNSYASASDIITDGYNGFLVSNNDMNLYMCRLVSLMSDYNLRYQMARNCVERSKRFDKNAICDDWVQLFKQLI